MILILNRPKFWTWPQFSLDMWLWATSLTILTCLLICKIEIMIPAEMMGCISKIMYAKGLVWEPGESIISTGEVAGRGGDWALKRVGWLLPWQKKDVRMLRFIQEVNTTTRSCALWDLEEDTEYIVHVQAISIQGQSPASEPVLFKTPREAEKMASKNKGRPGALLGRDTRWGRGPVNTREVVVEERTDSALFPFVQVT